MSKKYSDKRETIKKKIQDFVGDDTFIDSLDDDDIEEIFAMGLWFGWSQGWFDKFLGFSDDLF